MQEEAFRVWLKDIDGRPVEQVRDNVSRVKRIEKSLNVNLDISSLKTASGKYLSFLREY